MLRLWWAVADWWTGRWRPKVLITPVVTGVRVVHGEGGAVTSVVVTRAMMTLSAYSAQAWSGSDDTAVASPAGGEVTTSKEKSMSEQLAAEQAKLDERRLAEAVSDAASRGKLEWSQSQDWSGFKARHGEYEVQILGSGRLAVRHLRGEEGAVVLYDGKAPWDGLYAEVVRQHAVARGGVVQAANAFQRLVAGL